MKKQILLVMLSLIVLFTGCSKDSSQIQEPIHQINLNDSTFPHSMKGWDLYSWPNGSDWYYSILVGTNRLKSCDEVMTSEAIVIGMDSLKTALDKFPEGENIIWIGRSWLDECWNDNFGNLSLPPRDIVDEIKQYCADVDLTLDIAD
jgi:hypothetical protein